MSLALECQPAAATRLAEDGKARRLVDSYAVAYFREFGQYLNTES